MLTDRRSIRTALTLTGGVAQGATLNELAADLRPPHSFGLALRQARSRQRVQNIGCIFRILERQGRP